MQGTDFVEGWTGRLERLRGWETLAGLLGLERGRLTGCCGTSPSSILGVEEMDADEHQIHQFAASVLGLSLAPLHAHFSPIAHVTKRPSQIYSGPTTPRSFANLRQFSKNTTLPSSKARLNLHLRHKTQGPWRKAAFRPGATEAPVNSVSALARYVMAAHVNAGPECRPSFSAAGEVPGTKVSRLRVEKEVRPLTMLRARTLTTMTVVAPVVEGRTLKTARTRSSLKSIPEEGL